jgi:WD repeat-containing protein 76
MPPKKEAVISAFERKRLENIANNNAILSGISNTADKIIPKKASPAKEKSRAPARPRVKREPIQREAPRATRRSGRLAGIDASDETLKRKLEVEAEAETEKAKAKKMRVSGDLNLGDITVEGRKWEGGVDGLSLLKGLSVRGAQPGVRTFTDEDVEATTDKGLKDLRLRMGGLKLYEKWPVNGLFPPLSRLLRPRPRLTAYT